MFTDVLEISVNYEEDGTLTVKELDKEILSKGAWTTILFRYREWDHKSQDYGPDKFTIRRYRKMSGVYRQQSKFNISSRKQAEKIIETLSRWLESEE